MYGPVSWAGLGPMGRFRHGNWHNGFPVFSRVRHASGPIAPVPYRERDKHCRNYYNQQAGAGFPREGRTPTSSGRSYLQPSARVRMARRMCSGNFGQASTSRDRSAGSSDRSVQPVCNREASSPGTACVPLPCNAALSDSGSACLGSNPSSPVFNALHINKLCKSAKPLWQHFRFSVGVTLLLARVLVVRQRQRRGRSRVRARETAATTSTPSRQIDPAPTKMRREAGPQGMAANAIR
jgi:hypothetical protein